MWAITPKGLLLTLVVNWLIKPFTMAALGWLFFKVIFADWVDPQSASEYIAGMILLGVAPCTAMVFVWSQLTKGNPNYTLVQVAINDVIMVFAFAPLAAFLLGVTDISVPWETLLLSVLIYVLLPLVAGAFTRHRMEQSENSHRLDDFLHQLKPWSMIGLLATVVLLFGFQAETILQQPQTIVLIAIPLLIQTYGIFAIAFRGSQSFKVALQHSRTGMFNRHFEFFRTGRSCGNLTVWPAFRCGTGYSGRRIGRGARYVVTRRFC